MLVAMIYLEYILYIRVDAMEMSNSTSRQESHKSYTRAASREPGSRPASHIRRLHTTTVMRYATGIQSFSFPP